MGSGKTHTALAYYKKAYSELNLVIITTAKKRNTFDWQDTAVQMHIGAERGLLVNDVVTVDSWNNIADYEDAEDVFVIFDEQRVVGSGAWVKSFLKIAKRNPWILLSATPGDTWVDYIPLFVANGLYRNVTQFKNEHIVYEPFIKFPKIKYFKNVPLLEKYRNMLLVEMKYEHHMKQTRIRIDCEYDEALYNRVWNDRWHVYEDRPLKDVAEMFRVAHKVDSSDPSRLRHIRRIMKDHPKIIVFYNRDYELDILRNLAYEVPFAEYNGKKHEHIPDTDRWVYVLQYLSGSEGWNCIETNTIVHYSLPYSYRNYDQSQGRIKRLDSPFDELFYYELSSKTHVSRAVRRSLDQKQSFNERAWAFKNRPDMLEIGGVI